ncbi:SCO family protein [Roseivivax sediminis]|uniref:Protein SCO1/2 n=1 Tax=Roseivivax sediminis TaxID=936889 RepID=A0A1I1TEV5_9RHOB|nr:SCO family protein [Roseivivax sediminis]SFD57104.1 protein SCO1/2 [Roseivivax sediminis]
MTGRRIALGAALVVLTLGTARAETPFPIALGGSFTLTDDNGAARTEAAEGADLQLLFFGYANCEQICSAALPLMGGAVDRLTEAGLAAVPVMVTVDPGRDRVGTMSATLAAHHPAFVGLTGTEAELQSVYDLFGVEKEILFRDPAGAPVYAHGSHIYLLDGAGRFLTLLPPILAPERLAEIAQGYIDG